MSDFFPKEFLGGARWSILRTLSVGGHLGATDKMILDVLRAEYLAVTRAVVRDELDYLEKRKLVDVARSEVDPWRAVLTRAGRDVVDYQVPVEPGITRPPRLEG